jgi:CDP-diacylglycerol--glycerol-3-phosphate 3-phosphatidyltransferase
MNIANKLTISRIILTPVFLAVILIPQVPFRFFISGLIFGAASITDYYDGKIARQRKLVTNFGKFLDPIADKLLVCAALFAFTWLNFISAFVPFLVVAREFAVSSVRMISAGKGTVVAANKWGKIKTVAQMVAILVSLAVLEFANQGCFGLFVLPAFVVPLTVNVLIWVSVVLTVISGINYIWLYRNHIKDC